MLFVFFFFFSSRRRHTRFSRDWSSDVCSSDLMSSTLQDPKWTNVKVLTGGVVDEVTRLKHEVDGDVVVYASYQVGRTLIEHDLVDELRLFVFPVVVGDGERLFGRTTGTKGFRLLGNRTVGDGLAFLTYEIVRDV